MNVTAIDALQDWIGKTEHAEDVLHVRHANLMAATIGANGRQLTEGDALPPLWHWLYFLDGLPPDKLGRDGHPQRGGFLPPVELPNRMWAGGRVKFLNPLPIGAKVEKHSRILNVDHKQGRSGELVFVTVLHEILHDGAVAVSEEHDIVYKEAASQGFARREVSRTSGEFSEPVDISSTTLFRYSALTFNGHRIHYDQDYCRSVEGYPNLVIHGPLSATLLAGFAQRVTGKPLREFEYRGVQPAILGDAVVLNASKNDDVLELWTTLDGGLLSMQASGRF